MNRLSLSRRMIQIELQRLRDEPDDSHSLVYTVAVRLGYTIDKNGSNDFVRRVIRDILTL